MRNSLIGCVLLIGLAPTAGAQWLNVRTPGIPRTADGKPMLDAPAPRSADGRPDLSGLWQPGSYTYLRNIMADMRPEDVPFQSWAAAVYETRTTKVAFGTTPGPIYFGADYVSQQKWWQLGLIASVANILIWASVGLVWWKILGWW